MARPAQGDLLPCPVEGGRVQRASRWRGFGPVCRGRWCHRRGLPHLRANSRARQMGEHYAERYRFTHSTPVDGSNHLVCTDGSRVVDNASLASPGSAQPPTPQPGVRYGILMACESSLKHTILYYSCCAEDFEAAHPQGRLEPARLDSRVCLTVHRPGSASGASVNYPAKKSGPDAGWKDIAA